jgi:hypothetical protein
MSKSKKFIGRPYNQLQSGAQEKDAVGEILLNKYRDIEKHSKDLDEWDKANRDRVSEELIKAETEEMIKDGYVFVEEKVVKCDARTDYPKEGIKCQMYGKPGKDGKIWVKTPAPNAETVKLIPAWALKKFDKERKEQIGQ